MQVRDYMTAKVFTVQPDSKMVAAAEIMDWAWCRHVPVVDKDQRVLGLVSQRDLLAASLASGEHTNGAEQKQHLGRLRVQDVMNPYVQCIDPDATIQAAARLMRAGRYGCLPVVDHHDVLIGIVTEHDLLGVVENLPLTVEDPA